MFRKAQNIILDVALEHGISIEMLRGPGRTRTVARARQEACRRLREQTDLSWSEIAMAVGRKSAIRTSEVYPSREK